MDLLVITCNTNMLALILILPLIKKAINKFKPSTKIRARFFFFSTLVGGQGRVDRVLIEINCCNEGLQKIAVLQ